MIILSMVTLGLSLLPLAVAAINLRLLKAPDGRAGQFVSVLIPARNEEAHIRTIVTSALASDHPRFEIVVLDDHSSDRTASIVDDFARDDARVRLERAPDLPPGWCGKMHACQVLAERSAGDLLVFVDADVTLRPDALSRLDGYMGARPALSLASGVPRQVTGTVFERLTVPMINFLLIGYLPVWVMRWWPVEPSLAVGCGQLMVVRRPSYFAAGGHAAIRTTLHDGLKLPRLMRRNGYATDLFDGTGIASCRMYTNARDAWRGFGKNAREGMATPKALPPWTVILAGGQLLPFVMLGVGLSADGSRAAMAIASLSCLAVYGTRILIGRRFGDSPGTIIGHPLGIVILLLIQWIALVRQSTARRVSWKGRTYG